MSQLRETFWLDSVIRLAVAVGSAPVRRAGKPGSIPGPGKNSSLKFIKIIVFGRF